MHIVARENLNLHFIIEIKSHSVQLVLTLIEHCGEFYYSYGQQEIIKYSSLLVCSSILIFLSL